MGFWSWGGERDVCPDTKDGDDASRVTHFSARTSEDTRTELGRTQQAAKYVNDNRLRRYQVCVDSDGFYRR